jgi:hypothetical protein
VTVSYPASMGMQQWIIYRWPVRPRYYLVPAVYLVRRFDVTDRGPIAREIVGMRFNLSAARELVPHTADVRNPGLESDVQFMVETWLAVST